MNRAHIIDGKSLAKILTKDLRQTIGRLSKERPPGLATVIVGDDKASALYVANKRRQASEVGIKSFHHDLPKNSSEDDVLLLIHNLNADPTIDAILVQLPLPPQINEKRIIDAIHPDKDVDGFHPLNLGYLLRGEPRVVACTPMGIMHLIKSVDYSLRGKHAVVIGRSIIVGKPIAQLLLDQDATVTITHSKTKDLPEITRQADVVVAAIGRPKMINRTYLKQGAFVVDVGINRDEDGILCGDVDFEDVLEWASYITPVPGGVGPLTIAMLLQNTLSNFMRVGT